MRLKIGNFVGVGSADLDLSRIALVAGPNAAGKSSVALAAGAALTGEPIPLDGIPKGSAGVLVHGGTPAGYITLTSDGGERQLRYPGLQVLTSGTPPAASRFAVGRERLADRKPKDVAATIGELLKAAPTRDEIVAAALKLGLSAAHAAKLATRVQELGWDAAHEAARETGQGLKAKWATVAGEQWGSAKGAAWLPKGWAPGLEASSKEALDAAVTEAREGLEAAIAVSAVSDAERERLQALASGRQEISAQLDQASSAAAALRARVEKAAADLRAMPRPADQEHTTPCPHCSEAVVIRGGALSKPAVMDPEANRAKASARASATAALAAMEAELRALDQRAAQARADLFRATEAETALERLPAAGGGPAKDVNRARQEVDRASELRWAFTAKSAADGHHAAILLNLQVQAMLSPDGLRLTKLSGALAGFNAALARWSQAASWSTVELGQDMVPTYGGRSVLLSASERWRRDVILQIAIADLDGSAALVIDAADVLNRPERNGLMRLLVAWGRPALVCMTMAARDAVPYRPGIAASYWLEDGIAQQIVSDGGGTRGQ